jgi:hypothetical protein
VFLTQRGKPPRRKIKRQKSKGKNLCAGPRAGWGRNLQGLAAIKTIINDSIVNDSILERRRAVRRVGKGYPKEAPKPPDPSGFSKQFC